MTMTFFISRSPRGPLGPEPKVFPIRTIWSIQAFSGDEMEKLYMGAAMTIVSAAVYNCSYKIEASK
jgi:hypothetical protein